jgi:hypothetical protein
MSFAAPAAFTSNTNLHSMQGASVDIQHYTLKAAVHLVVHAASRQAGHLMTWCTEHASTESISPGKPSSFDWYRVEGAALEAAARMRAMPSNPRWIAAAEVTPLH